MAPSGEYPARDEVLATSIAAYLTAPFVGSLPLKKSKPSKKFLVSYESVSLYVAAFAKLAHSAEMRIVVCIFEMPCVCFASCEIFSRSKVAVDWKSFGGSTIMLKYKDLVS
jgi:hypothetical protein